MHSKYCTVFKIKAQLGPRPEEPRGSPVSFELLQTHKDEDGRIHRVDELKWAILKGVK